MNEAWKNKNTDSCFDVPMGNYDGAEICELVGIFILKSLEDKINKQDIVLYRDDGLMILRNANGQKTDRTRKYIIKVMKHLGFQIEIKTNLKEVNFLDVTFDFNSGLHMFIKNRTTSYFMLRPLLITLFKFSNNFQIPSIENSLKIHQI